MKKLNLYKIIAIFVSFALFLIIFNHFQHGEPNFEVNDSMFDVYESVHEWEKSMNNSIPQLQLAKEIGAIKNNQQRIPLLAAERDLMIHDVMVVHYGAVYVTYSFSMKEKDEPYNIPTLQIGSLRFKGNGNADQSYLVNQQQISSQTSGKPSVINHRIYRADILYPNLEEANFIEEFDQLPDADSVMLENLEVQVSDEKVKVDNQELDLSSDYPNHLYGEADLNQSVHTEEGNFIFTHLEAGLNSNKLYIEGMDNPLARIVMKNANEKDFFSFERPLLKDDRGTFVALEPFRSLQEKFSYKVSEVIFNQDGVIRKELTKTDWNEMEKDEKILLGEYSGLTYSIQAEDKGDGNQLVLSIDAKTGEPPQLLSQFYMESKQAYEDRLRSVPEEERAIYEEQKPPLLSIKDKNKNDVLIYQTSSREVPKEFRIDFDYEHFSSGLPAVITLSNLPDFESVGVNLKGTLELNEKNK
ncbi:hypothetical protein [Bacillus sp. RAR_GA_16]|uniref:hypothetical protein n=1 Tax=Bacillus sp. RAR_GA_16 TaxID=2876774 RepID=UPI001CC9B768|nr:hypothetical protein [Bacillus sp. RAR_GA_16]MCA0172379.1 hypothetical protein [Bacillus sp. RAR_GA_16]